MRPGSNRSTIAAIACDELDPIDDSVTTTSASERM
jgi:hypothetical protein